MSKTINDIVREMRTDMPRVVDTKVILRNYADRIEAAVKVLEADRDNWRRQALAEDERANIANSPQTNERHPSRRAAIRDATYRTTRLRAFYCRCHYFDPSRNARRWKRTLRCGWE